MSTWTPHPVGTKPIALSTQALDGELAAIAYDEMPHIPNHDTVRGSYGQLERVIRVQYNLLLIEGLDIRFHDGAHDYPSSAEMFADLERGRLWTYRTQPGQLADDHPMQARYAHGLILNDIFRAVHDVYGHFGGRFSFGPRGEEQAWMAHRATMPRGAHLALWCETRGQNTWTNREEHWHLPLTERPYATQKAGIVPSFLY